MLSVAREIGIDREIPGGIHVNCGGVEQENMLNCLYKDVRSTREQHEGHHVDMAQ